MISFLTQVLASNKGRTNRIQSDRQIRMTADWVNRYPSPGYFFSQPALANLATVILTYCNYTYFYSSRIFCTDIARYLMQMDKRKNQRLQSGVESALLRNLFQPAQYLPWCPPASILDLYFNFQISKVWSTYFSECFAFFTTFARITEMNEPNRSKNDLNSKRQRKISRDRKSERRNGRDRRKGVDRRSGFDRRRDQDRGATERKNLTRE